MAMYPNQYEDQAKQLIAAGRFPELVACMNEALHYYPQMPSAFFMRAFGYCKLGQGDLGLQDINASMSFGMVVAESFNIRGKCWFLRAQSDADYHYAIADFNKAIEMDPSSWEPVAYRAQAFGCLGFWQESLRDCEFLLSQNPKEAAYHFGVGKSLMHLRRYDDAIPCFAKAIDLNPNVEEFYCFRADCLRRSGRLDIALMRINQFLSNHPQHGEGYLTRADIHEDKGDIQSALNDYNRSFELGTSPTERIYKRGRLLRKIGEHQHAITDITAALERTTVGYDHYNAFQERAYAYRELGNEEAAERDFATARELINRNADEIRNNQAVEVEGWVVTANNELFSPGEEDRFGKVLITFDPALADPKRMMAMVEQIDTMKGAPQKDANLQQALDEIVSEYVQQNRRIKLPAALSGPHDVFVADILIHRQFLSAGHLTEPCIQCLAEYNGRIAHIL